MILNECMVKQRLPLFYGGSFSQFLDCVVVDGFEERPASPLSRKSSAVARFVCVTLLPLLTSSLSLLKNSREMGQAEGTLRSHATGFLGKFPGRKGRECRPETGAGVGAALFATTAS